MFAVGWKRTSKAVNTYVGTASTTLPASSKAHICFRDEGNAQQLIFERPAVVELYASGAGVIDNHNMLRQGDLRLEKHWKTHKWAFRVITTVIGICVVDTFLAWKKWVRPESPITLMDFVDMLVYELVGKAAVVPPSSPPPSTPQVHILSHTDVIRVETSSDGTTRRRYRQLPCRYCAAFRGHRNQKTTFRCETCDIALCNEATSGRTCYRDHISAPSSKLTQRVRRKKASAATTAKM